MAEFQRSRSPHRRCGAAEGRPSPAVPVADGTHRQRLSGRGRRHEGGENPDIKRHRQASV